MPDRRIAWGDNQENNALQLGRNGAAVAAQRGRPLQRDSGSRVSRRTIRFVSPNNTAPDPDTPTGCNQQVRASRLLPTVSIF